MKRFVGFSLICLICFSSVAHAQFGAAWRHPPTVAVISAPGDPRLGLVDEAVAFWNQALKAAGSTFRLGQVTHIAQVVPEEALQTLGASISDGDEYLTIPTALSELPGDITIVLGQSAFVSFTTFLGSQYKRIVGIRGMNSPPLNLPNVARNVIAHELGHAIGLDHNSDPSTLMCGRPARCRPTLFYSSTPHVFPLTESEKLELLRMYPSVRKPRAAGDVSNG